MSGLEILEEISNLYQARKMTQLQIAGKYGTTQKNITYILMNLGFNNTLLKNDKPSIETAWQNPKVREICEKICSAQP